MRATHSAERNKNETPKNISQRCYYYDDYDWCVAVKVLHENSYTRRFMRFRPRARGEEHSLPSPPEQKSLATHE